MYSFWVALLLITEIVLFLVAFEGDWISPSVVTLMFFILSTVSCLYGISDWKNVIFTGKAYSLFSLAFIIMIMVEKWVAKHKIIISKKVNLQRKNVRSRGIIIIESPFDKIIFIVFLVAALLYIYRVVKSGMSLGAASVLYAIGANKEDGDFDGISRFLYNFVRIASYGYIVMVSNNIFACKQRPRKCIKEIIIIFLTILMTFFSGQRSATICYIVSIVVAMFISLYDRNKGFFNKDIKKYVNKIAVIAILVVVLFFLTANIVKNSNSDRHFIDYLTYYFGSTTALMGNIVEDPSCCHYPFVGYFGEKTFMGFWSTLYSWGIVSQAPADRRWINMGAHIANRAGNEYTFLCGPYIDFGFVGALIFVAVFYGIFSYLYYWKIRRCQNFIKRIKNTAIYIFLYSMVAMAFYQDTIRTYSRPISVLYIIYIVVFCKIFLRIKME